MTEEEAKAIFYTVKRTEDRIARIEIYVLLTLAAVIGMAVRGYFGWT